jgi:multidrug efflux pump subunit AcrA (membrane-fusion protein)
VEIRIQPTDPEGILRPGMSATVTIVIASRQNVLLVPHNALLATDPAAQPALLTVDGSYQVHTTPVQLGLQNAQTVEISSGLSEGQVVATSNVTDLRDGDLVVPQLQGPTSALGASAN